MDVVLRLVGGEEDGISGSGQNIATDNWFGSYDLAERLTDQNLSFTTTL